MCKMMSSEKETYLRVVRFYHRFERYIPSLIDYDTGTVITEQQTAWGSQACRG